VILALDSSTSVGSAALVDAGRLLREETFPGGRARGGGVARAIADLTAEAGQISAVVVGIGPGSYSGIRSAVAAAWGFAVTRKAALFGVSSLLALAPGEYFAAGDARRGQLYLARVREGEFSESPHLLTAEELKRHITQCKDLPVYVPPESPEIAPGQVVATPRAALLAGFVPVEADHPPPWPPMPVPLYLKPPSITFPKT
jgi:tRNA threonylcarbamoyl adenosine modification protein YeaZ